MLVRSLQARNTRVETTVFRNVAYALNESSKTFTIEPGKAGYAGFKPEMQCFTGVVETKSESCASGSVFDDGAREVQRLFDGKGLEFCIPLYRRRTAKPRRTEVRGKAGLVNVTREEASRPEMSVNPFRIVVDDEDDAPTGTSATPRPSVSRVSSTQRLDMSMFNVFVVILFMLVI